MYEELLKSPHVAGTEEEDTVLFIDEWQNTPIGDNICRLIESTSVTTG